MILAHSRCQQLLARFPKARPALPPEYQAIHREQYVRSRRGLSLASRLSLWTEQWMHRRVAADVAGRPGPSTLEVGPGTLNHLPFERQTVPYDIVEPFTELYAESAHRVRIRTAYTDIREIPEGIVYQRILSIATFEHVLDLPAVVARCGLLLAPDGCLRVGIPSEGGPLWRLAYQMTTGYAFKRRYGLDYTIYMQYEHVNTAAEIADILRCFFRCVSVRSLGIGRRWSLYQFFSCTDPDRGRCAAYWHQSAVSRPRLPDARRT